MSAKKEFYITTAIDYPNGNPHIGHAYEKIVTDFYARWYRQLGYRVHFLTGTDENGQKLLQSAQNVGKNVNEFVAEYAQVFRDFCHQLNITFDDFIRTTESRHQQAAIKIWESLKNQQAIYFDKYEGLYCFGCETFYTETQAPEGKCPEHHKPLEVKSEEGYFFKLSQYESWLLDYINTHPDFIVPSSARKEILGRLKKEGLKDLAISRPNQNWGIPVPGDDRFVMYTWFDALINYYSALGSDQLKKDFWPCDAHVIGKDITWFHTVIWPCILKAANIEPPKQVYVHGMVLAADGKKMSKSLGNVIDPFMILEKYPLDSIRYYILRSISAHADGSFVEQELKDRHNSELGNDFGNLVMRVLKLCLKKIGPDMPLNNAQLTLPMDGTFTAFKSAVKDFEHHRALDILWESIRKVNAYINTSEPWKIKENPELLHEVLYNCLYAIHCATYLLCPAMPNIAQKIYAYLGLKTSDLLKNPCLHFGQFVYRLSEPEILFVKFESE